MLSAWRLCSRAGRPFWTTFSSHYTDLTETQTRSALLPKQKQLIRLSEGMLHAKLSMIVELSNDRSRSFSDDSTNKEERDSSAREVRRQFFIILTLLSARSADALDSLLTGRRIWSKALSNSESPTTEAELGTASRMSYFSTASRKRFVANLLACFHDLHRRHCHHHPLVLYTEDRHILPLKLFPLHVPVVQMIAPGMTVCSCSDIRNMTPDAAEVIPLPTYISPSDASLLNLQQRPINAPVQYCI